MLLQLRHARGFEARSVAEVKLARLGRFFASQRLDSAVVGVSGGVDSALVLALLLRVGLRRVVPLLLPIESPGATRQAEALERGRLVTRTLRRRC